MVPTPRDPIPLQINVLQLLVYIKLVKWKDKNNKYVPPGLLMAGRVYLKSSDNTIN